MSWDSMFEYNFPGLQYGCDCGSAQYPGDDCQSRAGCVKIISMTNQTFTRWGDESVPQTFTMCVLRFKRGNEGYNFLNNYYTDSGCQSTTAAFECN